MNIKSRRDNELINRGLDNEKNGKPADAICCFLNAIEKEPDQADWVYRRLGELLINEERIAEAREVFIELTNKFPNRAVGLAGQAKIAHTEKSWDFCTKFWAECFKKFPSQRQPYWFIGYAEAFMHLGQFEDAIEVYESCIDLFPKTVQAYVGAARLYQSLKLYPKALEYWNVCFDKFPSKKIPLWRKHRLRIYFELGMFKKAQADVIIALKEAGQEAYAQFLLDKMKNPQLPALNFKHILIVTYGRSGSTLLQGILNAIPGVIVRGENGNIFYDFYKLYQKIATVQGEYKSAILPHQSWFGIGLFNLEDFLGNLKEAARAVLVGAEVGLNKNQCLGFKEIRYDEVGEDFDSYLDFLSELFPETAFIFNTRNLQDVVRSGWWKAKARKQVLKKLGKLEGQMSLYSEKRSNCFHITYSDVLLKGQKLKELHEFLGARFDQTTIDLLLNIPHSYVEEQR